MVRVMTGDQVIARLFFEMTARGQLSKLLSIDSADMFGQDNTTRAVITEGLADRQQRASADAADRDRCRIGAPYGRARAKSSFLQWEWLSSFHLARPSRGDTAALASKKREASMRKKIKASFDPKKFLAKVGEENRVISTGRIKLSSPRETLRTRSFTFSEATSS